MEKIRRYANPLDMLQAMLLIRAYEERLAALQAEAGLPGTCTAVGQEACAVGVIAALSEHDLILTNHRSAGHLLARGADPARMVAEVMGKRTGYCGGKSGSLHISVKGLGVVLTSTIVGGELSLATGVALSQRMRGRPGIVVCFSATARRAKASSTSRSTSPRCGTCRCSTCARTTSGRRSCTGAKRCVPTR